MNINPMLSPSRDIFLQARKEENATAPTQQGVRMANKLVAQYGGRRMVVVAGDVAVALKPQTFSEMAAKFGKAKEIEKGVYTFNSEGPNLVANWYKTAVEDEGYGKADADGDGFITNNESMQAKHMITFDPSGKVVLKTPPQGGIANDDNIYISLNDAIERDISSDKNKDGVITTKEVKEKEGIDIDMLRAVITGLNPDGTAIAPTKEDLEQTLPGLEALDALKKQQDKLKEIEARKQELRNQGVTGDDPEFKELMAAETALLGEIGKTDTYQSIDVKA